MDNILHPQNIEEPVANDVKAVRPPLLNSNSAIVH